MLITKNRKKTFYFCCVLLFFFFFDPGRGCLFSSAPLSEVSSLVIPRKRTGPFYDNLPPPARSGAPEDFGQSQILLEIQQILLENIAYYDHSPVNFAKKNPKNYGNLRTRFSDLTKQQQHNTRYVTKNPNFSRIFRHYSTKEAMQMEIQAGASGTPTLFFRPDNRSTPKMQSNRQHQSRDFHQNQISTVHSSDCQKRLLL